MTARKASHAGSWYTSKASTVSSELDGWLSLVPSEVDGKTVPVKGARVIIAPHAGYAYSGPCAAYAYAAIDLTNIKRIFLLGPSHALYLPGCALSSHSTYSTPLGPLTIDSTINAKLAATGRFDTMSEDADETEHSMEMHLPYIHKMVSRAFASPEEYPTLVPILVGNTNEAAEKTYGAILAEYLADEQNAFVVSSDFCHWGTRFQYTYYLPSEAAAEASRGVMLKRRDKTPTDPHICDSIGTLDNLAMKAIESGAHSTFLTNLKDTGNTVCGRHPIGVLMAAVEVLREKEEGKDGKFKFLRYERSSEVVDISDSSVSYASAYAVI